MDNGIRVSSHLNRKNTCPECRSKTTQSKVIRLYANIADSSYLDAEAGPQDVVALQSENDSLKYQLVENNSAIKSKEDSIARLLEENKKLTMNTAQSRNIILTLEQKLETSKVITLQHTDQVHSKE